MVDRRGFLRALGVAAGATGAGGLLAACGSDAQGGIPGGDPSINVGVGSYETLVGDERRLNLVLTEVDQAPITAEDVAVYLRVPDGETLSGPHDATYHPETGEGTGTGAGIHQTLLPLPDAGLFEVVAVQGGRYGVGAVRVLTPEQSEAPAPGSPAPRSATPTAAADQGVSPLCTEDPPCPMHEVSLDGALAEGRPVLLLFATPAYCQTIACGPSVGNLSRVRDERDWGDIAFVHCEIWLNEESVGSGFVPAVQEWGLPTEPWLFAIGADGVITDRLDGPMLDADMRRLAESLAV